MVLILEEMHVLKLSPPVSLWSPWGIPAGLLLTVQWCTSPVGPTLSLSAHCRCCRYSGLLQRALGTFL